MNCLVSSHTGACGSGKRALVGGGAVLGDLAISDTAVATATCPPSP